MLKNLQKLARKAQSAVMAGRPVLARAEIVRRGHYVPRGATGRILRVRLDGSYEIAFDLSETERLCVHPHEVAPAPTLAARGIFGRRILSH